MIYTDYWGFEFAPFAGDSRPETFVPTHSAGLAIARLRYSLGMEMGPSALFGEPGLGKTRVAKMLVGEFAAAGWFTAYIPGPRGTARDILARLEPGGAAGLAPTAGIVELEAYIADRMEKGQPSLLAVDDVQAARSVEFLEILRSLLNIEHDDRPALSLLLIGQADMEKRLAAASGLDSRLSVRAVLEPMSADETKVYILARLKAAGSSHGIFTRQAADRVTELAYGSPRQVNRLCEMCLVIGYGLNEKRITPEIVGMAAADLDMLPGEEAAFHPWPHPDPELTGKPEGDVAAGEEDILAALPVEEDR